MTTMVRRRQDHFWEIDALRGVAIVMMVIYHFMYDLYLFRISNQIFTLPFWATFQRVTAFLFITLVGISLTISYSRALAKQQSQRSLAGMFLLRALRIFGLGLVITVITRLALGPDHAIRFGILHFIGTSIAIAYPFLRWRWVNLLLAVPLLALGIYLQSRTFELPGLFWLGLRPLAFTDADYFPLLPWFGLILIGLFLGNSLYRGGIRRWSLPAVDHLPPFGCLRRLGQHSLVIYLLHQPLLYGLFIVLLNSRSNL